ncbi:MAG: CDP-alcohol phosphatidyltransferase family protein, partial [Planctomycetes bacterium]|nr:CDP-alcohol phosphatidyltransferase family protein [Planctomycetota bacterium]
MRLVPRWLPNAISTLRIALVPGWVALAEAANRAAETGGPAERLRWSAVAVLIAIGVSDVLDGFLARRFGLQSHLGAVLDAVADKLAQVVVFFYLALRQGPEFATVPLWFLLVLVGRDLLLLLGCAIVRWRAGRVRVDHRPHGP